MIPWPVVIPATKAFLSRYWKVLLVGGVAIAAALFIRSYMYNVGYNDAYKKLNERFEQREEQINGIWADRVIETAVTRDEYWTALLDEERQRVEGILADNAVVRQREEELQQLLREQAASYNDLLEEFNDADFGTANFSSDADRLLNAAYYTAYRVTPNTTNNQN